jgi:hypothetical protein
MPADRPQKITLAEMRAAGVRGLVIYCSDYKCTRPQKITFAEMRAARCRASFALRVLIGSDSGMVSISHRKWGDRHSEILRCSFSS